MRSSEDAPSTAASSSSPVRLCPIYRVWFRLCRFTILARRPGLWLLVRLGWAWRLALSRGQRAAAKRRRPIVIVALEPVSADWFYEILVTSSRRRRSNGEWPLQFRIVRVSSSEALRRLVGNQPASTIIVAELDRWLWELEKCDVLYLRPALLILKDVLPGISRRATAGAPAAIQLVDRLLSRYPTIDLETLFYEPHKAADYLQRRVGFKFELDDFPAAHEDRYRKALLAILRLVERGSFANNTEMFSFAVGGTYSTTSGGAGLLALGEGWSWPESEHTWSDGPRASLAIPLATNRGTRLHLRLDGMLAEGAMSVRVFAGGQLEMEIVKGEAMARDQPIMLSLPHPLVDQGLSIEFEFSNTFCPKDAGISVDGRHLGFALRSFTITEETLLAASLRSLFRWRSPEVTIALSFQQPGKGFGLSSFLAECGLSGSLITLADTQSDQGRWLKNGRPIPFPEFASTPRMNALPNATERQEGGPPTGGLREVCFIGTLPQLLADLAQRKSLPDLMVLSSGQLFGRVLDALEPAPDPLPEIAVCTDDPGFINQSFLQHGVRYARVVHRFAMAMVDPQLICFTGRIV